MNTTEFLESYKEIENLIRENLAEIHQAYGVPYKYTYNHFFIEHIDEVHIELVAECLNEYDYDYVNIPIEWFESDKTLKSRLAEIYDAKELNIY